MDVVPAPAAGRINVGTPWHCHQRSGSTLARPRPLSSRRHPVCHQWQLLLPSSASLPSWIHHISLMKWDRQKVSVWGSFHHFLQQNSRIFAKSPSSTTKTLSHGQTAVPKGLYRLLRVRCRCFRAYSTRWWRLIVTVHLSSTHLIPWTRSN